MEESLLSKVVRTTPGGTKTPGALGPDQEKKLLGNMNYESGATLVYKQFIPMRDAFEYTIYYVENGVKNRVDFYIEMQDFEKIDGAALEDVAIIAAKAAITSRRMEARRNDS